MNDEQQSIFESWAHGARNRLYQFGDIYYVDTKFLLSEEEHIYFIHSDFDEALKFFIQYCHALLLGMEEPKYILPYPWMYEIVEATEEDMEDDEWLLDILGKEFL